MSGNAMPHVNQSVEARGTGGWAQPGAGAFLTSVDIFDERPRLWLHHFSGTSN